VSDQFVPSTTADTEQFINMISALSKHSEIELLSASYRKNTPPSLEQINSYYFTDGVFSLNFIRHFMPNMRGLEKVFFAIRSALRIKKNQKIDVIYTRNIPIIISSLLFTDKYILFETYRPWPERNIFAKWFFKKMANQSRFAGIVLHSEFAKRSFTQVGFSEDKLVVEHNAIKTQLFSDIAGSIDDLRTELDLPKNKLIVAYTGTVSVQKGLEHFLTLAEAFPKVLFLIVGSEDEGAIEQKASVMENVKVVGRQDKKTVAKFISSSDVLYIPTSLRAREKAKNTVLPLKTFIYKAGGKPILAPDIEDIREVLKHDETALLVPPDDDEAAIAALQKLVDNEELRNKLGNKAKKEMESLTWEARAKNVLNFIERRLKTHSTRV
jgi:glycosyltransferase involved in cell wall biosynthesis